MIFQAELKRLYTQLQIYKTKTMRKDNPHISKRRGGRKTTHRRFSLQAFHKHRHHHDHDHDHEMSKTPEESTNSAEAMTFTMEPSVKEEPEVSTGGSMGSVGVSGSASTVLPGGGAGGGGASTPVTSAPPTKEAGGASSGRSAPSVSFKPGHT